MEGVAIMNAVFLGGFAAAVIGVNVANAQASLVVVTQALVIIQNTADKICYDVKQGGESTKDIVNSTVDNVASLHVSGSEQVQNEQYKGVIQEQLSQVLKISVDCKKSVFDMLVIRLIPTVTADTGLPVDRGVHLRPRTNEQPSISCSKTNEPVETLLCADADLALWDGHMGQIYQQRLQALGSNGQSSLRQSQRDWIKARAINCKVPKDGTWNANDLAPAKPCILQMTKQRVAELTNSH
jgi:uncharacterized protein YecT (DUF1311 family)